MNSGATIHVAIGRQRNRVQFLKSFRLASAVFGSMTLLLLTVGALQAQTYTLLYTFCSQPGCTDGATPNPNLVLDKTGSLYGTTQLGGDNSFTEGVAFKIGPSGSETVLFNFDTLGTGVVPLGGLILDDKGNLYGTASAGGITKNGKKPNCADAGCGLVFQLSSSGTETILFDFVNSKKEGIFDGKLPYGPLLRDASGNIFGLVQGFGQATNGGVFELKTDGTESVHWFGGRKQPKFPNSGLEMDAQGNIYGTTNEGGGYQGGTVFELTPGGEETTLYSFGNRKALQFGKYPTGGVVRDASGNLYGTTAYIGSNGTIFELTSSGTPQLLYTFQGQPDGSRPMGNLIRDAQGNLYGTTLSGGMYNHGTVFKLTPAGLETILYSFTGGADGGDPLDGLVLDGQGNLYGTTLRGGNTQCPFSSGGCGVAFKVTP